MFAILVFLAFCAPASQAQDAPFFFSPTDKAVVPPGPFRVIMKSPGKTQLLLDGKAVETHSPGPGAVRAELKIAPGEHELAARNEAGETKVRIFAGKQHAGFEVFRLHPPVSTCETCHAVKDGAWGMRRISLAPICSACHPQDRFAIVHTHGTDLLAECQSCHVPHGSTAAKHLKVSKDTACKQCHGQP